MEKTPTPEQWSAALALIRDAADNVLPGEYADLPGRAEAFLASVPSAPTLIPSSILVKLHGEMMERAEKFWRDAEDAGNDISAKARKAIAAAFEACARLVMEAHDAAVKGGNG